MWKLRNDILEINNKTYSAHMALYSCTYIYENEIKRQLIKVP